MPETLLRAIDLLSQRFMEPNGSCFSSTVIRCGTNSRISIQKTAIMQNKQMTTPTEMRDPNETQNRSNRHLDERETILQNAIKNNCMYLTISYNVAMIGSEETGQKSLRKPEVTENIDIEGSTNFVRIVLPIKIEQFLTLRSDHRKGRSILHRTSHQRCLRERLGVQTAFQL